MSVYSQVNEDATLIAPDQTSAGPQVGFMEGVKRSWQYGNLYESQLGVAQALLDAEYENNKRIMALGKKAPDSAYYQFDAKPERTGRGGDTGYNVFGVKDKTSALRVAGNFALAQANGDVWVSDAITKSREDQLAVLQRENPNAGIKTYAEMYGDVKSRYEKMRAGLNRDYTLAGKVGWLAGGMAAGVNPNTNPLSFETVPLGGGGRTVLQRMALQAGAQGAVQGVEEIAGIRSNKRALGENPTLKESLGNVAFAAIGGAALQGAGEAAGFVFKGVKRKWFGSAVNDPAPPVPTEPHFVAPESPAAREQSFVQLSTDVQARIDQAVRETVGTGRATRRISQVDLQHVASQLEDWAGPAPWEVAPPTYSHMQDAGVKRFDFNSATKGETVDEIARRIDPTTFNVYDKLAKERQGFRDAIANAMDAAKASKFQTEIAPLKDELARLEDKIAGANKRKTKIYEAQRAEIMATIANKESAAIGLDDKTTAEYRKSLIAADEKMRDLAPAVSRAYARAQNKWNVYEGQRAQLEKMVMRGETQAPTDYSHLVDKAEQSSLSDVATIKDAVPELKTLGLEAKPNEPAIDTLARHMENVSTAFDKQMEALKSEIPKLLKLEGEEAVLEVQGVQTKVKLSDEVSIDDGNGGVKNVTVRDMLDSVHEDGDVIGAIQTCSAGLISATA